MQLSNRIATLVCVFIPTWTFGADTPDKPSNIPLADFEAEPKGWTFIPGSEFPGAKGSLAIDSATAHGGKRSYKLQADFRGGGAYVGTWCDLAPLKGAISRKSGSG